MSNEAAKRLYALIERGGDRVALRVNVNLALAAERKATVERIRAALGATDPFRGTVGQAGRATLLAILDAEAAR